MLRTPGTARTGAAPLQSLMRTPGPGREATRPASGAADNPGPQVKHAGPGIRGDAGTARGSYRHVNSTLLDLSANTTRAGHAALPGKPGARAEAVYQLPGRAMRFGHGVAQARASDPPNAPTGRPEAPGTRPTQEGTPAMPVRTPGDPTGPAAQPQTAHVPVTADHGASTVPGRALAESAPFGAISPGASDAGHGARAEGSRTVIPMHFGTGHAGWLPRRVHGQKRAPARIRAQRRMLVWLTVAGLLLAWIALLAL